MNLSNQAKSVYNHPLLVHMNDDYEPVIPPSTADLLPIRHPLIQKIVAHNTGANEHNFMLSFYSALMEFCNFNFRGKTDRMIDSFDIDQDKALSFGEFKNLTKALNGDMTLLTDD